MLQFRLRVLPVPDFYCLTQNPHLRIYEMHREFLQSDGPVNRFSERHIQSPGIGSNKTSLRKNAALLQVNKDREAAADCLKV